jgi:hypothetical protein
VTNKLSKVKPTQTLKLESADPLFVVGTLAGLFAAHVLILFAIEALESFAVMVEGAEIVGTVTIILAFGVLLLAFVLHFC